MPELAPVSQMVLLPSFMIDAHLDAPDRTRRGGGARRSCYDNPRVRKRGFRRSVIAGCVGLFAAGALSAGCSRPLVEPLRLEGNLLTVDNRTDRAWTNVEIWLNTYYRVTTASIPAGGRFQVPLDAFVAGFGQRFNFRRTQVKDLRLTGLQPDGRRFELKKAFEVSGLAGALGGTK
jgi:hypothetical protein